MVVNPSVAALTPAVVHHPTDHPYIRHLTWPGRSQPAGRHHRRRSPVVWDVAALRAAGTRIVHLHFGFEHLSSDQVGRWVGDLHHAGIALVVTAHDLDNPHLIEQDDFHRSVDALIDGAAEVLTLTPAAAAVIEARHGRRATVVPHPHVVPLHQLARVAGPAGNRAGVYIHAATVRPNFDVDLLPALAEPARPHGGLLVHVRDGTGVDRIGLRRLREHGATVEVAARLTDQQLWTRLAAARLVVLPYRWGTHSGLLEAAHDLGTPTLAPGFGGYRDQGAHLLDPERLADCMRTAIENPPQVTVAERRRQRDAAAELHRRVYDRVSDGRS